MEKLKALWAKFKVQISFVAGCLVVATSLGTCSFDPSATSEDASDATVPTSTETTETTETVETTNTVETTEASDVSTSAVGNSSDDSRARSTTADEVS